MRLYIEPSSTPAPLSASRSWQDYITNTSGYDFRKGQVQDFALFRQEIALLRTHAPSLPFYISEESGTGRMAARCPRTSTMALIDRKQLQPEKVQRPSPANAVQRDRAKHQNPCVPRSMCVCRRNISNTPRRTRQTRSGCMPSAVASRSFVPMLMRDAAAFGYASAFGRRQDRGEPRRDPKFGAPKSAAIMGPLPYSSFSSHAVRT